MALCDCDYILPKNSVQEEHYDNCTSVWRTRHPSDMPLLKNSNGSIRLINTNVLDLEMDILYHLTPLTSKSDLRGMFGDVKFVCTGGTERRLKEFALHVAKELKLEIKDELVNYTEKSYRYAMYKVGPVLAVNHGIGIPSMTIALQEVIKLLYYAEAKDPIFFRLGTCGGLGVEAGCVVISEWGLNGMLQMSYDLPVLGVMRSTPSFLDKRLGQELHTVAKKSGFKFNTYLGGTMGTDDFYRGQARLDGPFCSHTEEDKLRFLHKISRMNVKNIEMEATAFAALISEAGVRGAIVCVPFLDRLKGDQVTSTKEQLTEWENHPMYVVANYIKEYYKNKQ